MRVIDIIKIKGSDVVSLPPSTTIGDLDDVLQDKRIGAVVVVDEGYLAGIVSERDVVRSLVSTENLADQTVAEIMTSVVLACPPATSVDELMGLMTEKRFRHLPVLDETGNVVGMISIGDMVKETISNQKFLIEQLERYIAG